MTWLRSAWATVKKEAKDIGTKAGHTLWQSFIAVLGVTWAASGLDVSQVTDVDSAKRFALAALMAVGAALLSAIKSTVSAISKDPAAYVGDHEAGASDVLLLLVVITVCVVLILLKVFAVI